VNTVSSIEKPRGASAKALKKLSPFLSHGLLVVVALLLLVPIIWLLITSLKRNTEYLSYPIVFLPAVPQWSNYAQVFAPIYDFLRHAGMTTFLAAAYSTLCVLSSSLSGYAFARYLDVKASPKLFGIIISLLLVPSIVTMIPSFMIFAKLRLTGTYWPWILWGLGASPYHIFLFRQFFLSFPKELEDAAEVDGCTPFGTFWRIFLPNAKAALATSFILNFMWVWGDWLTPRIYLRADNTTLSVLINTVFVNPQGQQLTTLTIAGIVIYTLPIVVIFFLSQRYILKGVVTSGLAGR
jgi:ABC-type glycerol-3-phosphate transport system permease component